MKCGLLKDWKMYYAVPVLSVDGIHGLFGWEHLNKDRKIGTSPTQFKMFKIHVWGHKV